MSPPEPYTIGKLTLTSICGVLTHIRNKLIFGIILKTERTHLFPPQPRVNRVKCHFGFSINMSYQIILDNSDKKDKGLLLSLV